MCSIANSFIAQVNHNLGNRSVEELIDKEYLSEVIKTQSIDDYLTVDFSDGSKATVDLKLVGCPTERPARETLAYKAKPFVKVAVGNALVYTNDADEIFVEFPNKRLRISTTSHGQIDISGMGKLKHYDGFKVVFE